MGIDERRAGLINQINLVTNEDVLVLMEATLSLHTGVDSTDCLTTEQYKELEGLMSEPDMKDILTEAAFRKQFSR